MAADLAGMLQRAGLAGARLFVIEERPLVDGRLPEDQVAPLRSWLHGLAADQEARAAVVRQTLTGALDSLEQRVTGVATAVEAQVGAADALRARRGRGLRLGARDGIDEGVRSGTLLRGEVLARWQEFVGTGEWMRALQGGVSRLRDRIVSAVTGRPTPADDLAGRPGEQRRAAAAGRGRPRRRAHRHGLALAAGRSGAARRRRARAGAGVAGLPRGGRGAGPGLAGRRPRPRPGPGGGQADPGAGALLGGQRRGRGRHGRGLRPDRRADRG